MKKQQLKDYLVAVTRTIVEPDEFKVRARNKTEARKIALAVTHVPVFKPGKVYYKFNKVERLEEDN